MMSFATFFEAARTPERALKVLHRIKAMPSFAGEPYPAARNQDKQVLKVKGHVTRHDLPPFHLHFAFKHWDKGPVEQVPIKDVIPVQRSVVASGVENKLKGKREGDHNKPVEMLHKDGKTYLMNGHHRFMTHRLLGKTHIDARVYRP
jgi:hypothetical protein